MRALITGVTGFIGSHLAEYLLNKGYKIYGNYYRGTTNDNIEHIKSQIKVLKVDVRDGKAIEKLLKEVKPDEVYHLAAQSYPALSWEDPRYTLETNIIGTDNLFQSILKLKISPKILLACSSAEYGFISQDELPVIEERILNPLHPYGVSKVATELLGYQYWKNFGLKVISVRIFNTIGPRKYADVCGDFCQQIAEIESGRRKPVIFVGNLNGKRGFLDIRDLIRALYLVMKRGKVGEVYNICGKRAIRVKELLDVLLKLAKIKISIREDRKKLRSTDEPIIFGDISKIKRDTGWKPEIPIEKTLIDTLNWWRERVNKI
ncbi:MAG: GDP-mannose 4,6-dehydratase [Candidatus Aenigmatarchaeota archaeon]